MTQTTISKFLVRTADIASMVPYWDKTDAIVEGYEAVKAGGDTYLPRFAGEEDADYKTRLNLGKYTNIYRDVLEGLATKPFEEEIRLEPAKKDGEVPQELQDFCENVDGSGNNLTMFAGLTFFNGINSAADWIFIDFPKTDRNVIVTIKDAKDNNIKPFWTHVLARNVLEVRSKIIGNKEVLSYVRVLEPGLGKPDCVRIFERSDDGLVTWQLWEKNEGQKKTDDDDGFTMIDSDTLSINVIPMVPFTTGRRNGRTWKFWPMMQDAADLQISLYQDESALQFIKTMAGYPMLAGNGVKPEKDDKGNAKKLAVGPMKVLYAQPNGNGDSGNWAYIEPSATSMEFLQKSIVNTKQDLRELGRQPLTATTGQLTVITTAVAAGKARSAVCAWALSLKDALENAMLITCMWMNIKDYEPNVFVYTEFDNLTEGAADVNALSTMRAAGDLSQETLWKEMQRRKVLSPEFNAEDEQKALLKEIPSDDDIDPNAPDDIKPKTPAVKPVIKNPAKAG